MFIWAPGAVKRKFSGADLGIFDWRGWGGGGGPNFGSERTVELFCGKLLLPPIPHPPHPLSPVGVVRYNSLAPYSVLEFYS